MHAGGQTTEHRAQLERAQMKAEKGRRKAEKERRAEKGRRRAEKGKSPHEGKGDNVKRSAVLT